MKRYIKKHFISDDGRPHHSFSIWHKSIRNLLCIVLVLELLYVFIPFIKIPFFTQSSTQFAAILPSLLASLSNNERQLQNLDPLVTNELLNSAAQLKAEDMVKNEYFSHVSPSGVTPWYWLDLVGYPYKYAGENLALGFIDSEDVTRAWMNSPTHRANIVKNKYTEVGTGIATGTYKGKKTIFVVQIYAQPRMTNTPDGLKKDTLVRTAPSELLERKQFNSLEYSR